MRLLIPNSSPNTPGAVPLLRAFVALACAGLLSSCLTVQEEKGEVRTSYSVNEGFWGTDDDSSRNADDSDEIRSKYADAGWTKDEDGEMTANNSDLFGDKDFGRGRGIEREESRFSNQKADKEFFDTPEYLQRQLFGDTKTAREGRDRSGEGLFGGREARESNRFADTDPKDGFLERLIPFKTDSAREGGRTFETSANRQATRAQGNAVRPSPVSMGEAGYYNDSVATLDDVKKLLNPEAFD